MANPHKSGTTIVAHPQRIKTGMRHKAGMGMRKPEEHMVYTHCKSTVKYMEQSKSCFFRRGKQRKPGIWVITPTPAPSKPTSRIRRLQGAIRSLELLHLRQEISGCQTLVCCKGTGPPSGSECGSGLVEPGIAGLLERYPSRTPASGSLLGATPAPLYEALRSFQDPETAWGPEGTVFRPPRRDYYLYLFGSLILPHGSWPLSSSYAAFCFCRKPLSDLGGCWCGCSEPSARLYCILRLDKQRL
ncbi:hypothetical protein F2Q70_00011699 [Brassica cretica]|nr:hypothetical protein F2Q70_00011699 [Brassica cretica]